MITGSTRDTDKDGQLGRADLKSLYVFLVESGKLETYDFQNEDVYSISLWQQSDLATIQMGLDKNRDGRYDDRSEPIFLKSLSLKTGKVDSLVSSDLAEKLQTILNK